MILFFQCDMWSCDCDCDSIMWYVTDMWHRDVTLTLTLSSQNKGKENRDGKEKRKIVSIYCLQLWQNMLVVDSL